MPLIDLKEKFHWNIAYFLIVMTLKVLTWCKDNPCIFISSDRVSEIKYTRHQRCCLVVFVDLTINTLKQIKRSESRWIQTCKISNPKVGHPSDSPRSSPRSFYFKVNIRSFECSRTLYERFPRYFHSQRTNSRWIEFSYGKNHRPDGHGPLTSANKTPELTVFSVEHK